MISGGHFHHCVRRTAMRCTRVSTERVARRSMLTVDYCGTSGGARVSGGGGGGFAMVAVLLVLVIAGVALAGLGRISLRQAVQTRQAERELQVRWGIRSLRASLMDEAEVILSLEEEASRGPVATVRRVVALGGCDFEVIVSDEQAKVHLGQLVGQTDVPATERAVMELTRGCGMVVTPMLCPVTDRGTRGRTSNPRTPRTRPPEPPESPGRAGGIPGGDEGLTRLGSWDQVFVVERGREASRRAWMAMLLGSDTPGIAPGSTSGISQSISSGSTAVATPFDHLTLWGDGKLNFRRASAETIRFTMRRVESGIDIERLVELRAANPGMDAEEALQLSEASSADQGRAAAMFTQSSRCHSLWIVARSGMLGRDGNSGRSDDGPRMGQTPRLERVVLVVRDESAPRPPRSSRQTSGRSGGGAGGGGGGASGGRAVEYVFEW